MTDNTESPKESKAGQESRRPRDRSPNYPALDLVKAVERAKEVYDAYKQVQVPITAIHTKWGYKSMSGLVIQTVAALKAYGLIEVSGDKDKRAIRLTDAAVKIIRNHPDRQGLLQAAALSPAVYAEVWDKYKTDGIPPDDILSNYLEWEKKFNPKAIAGFITDFRATIDFAKLSQGDYTGDNEDKHEEAPVEEKPPVRTIDLSKATKTVENKPEVIETWSVPWTVQLGMGVGAQLTISGMNKVGLKPKKLKRYIELLKRHLDIFIESLPEDEDLGNDVEEADEAN
ncbi:MAG: hypothetical protein NTZ17_10380 [Phycisphaerae bacterium]|nr:hypothetical protein [Phycisphaerae bacterium]